MTDRELFKHALGVLDQVAGAMPFPVALQVRAALRERLAQPEQMEQPEPDGLSWLKKDSNYFSQPKRKPWVGLTDEDKQTAVWTNGTFGAGALWADAKLKEKNA